MSLGVIVFTDVLKYFLVPKSSYWSAMDIVPLIVIANFFLGIYTNLSVWYKLIDKTKIGAYISIVGAIVTLVFNILLIVITSYSIHYTKLYEVLLVFTDCLMLNMVS